MKSYYQLIRHDGNQELFRTVEMSITALNSGHPFHIHAEGLRGTGKTTIMRAVKGILPPIVRIKNCLYNCHPARPHCPEHRSLSPEQVAAIGTEVVPCPFLEISQSAKIGTVVGSIDLSRLTDKLHPTAALLPGTIPQAHRGIIFIDEINRLADTSPELADVLLDVMGTKPGRIQIEETGLPKIELPVNVTIWAASNPDEEPGPLVQVRKQLSDRFDLALNMGRPSAYQDIMAILDNRSSQRLAVKEEFKIAGNMNSVFVSEQLRAALANIYVDYGIESIRAVEGMETAAALTALMNERRQVSIDDLIAVVPLVLGHRTDQATITSILVYLEAFKNYHAESESVSAGVGTAPMETPENNQANPAVLSRLKQFFAWLRNLLRQKSGQQNCSPEQRREQPPAGKSRKASSGGNSSGNQTSGKGSEQGGSKASAGGKPNSGQANGKQSQASTNTETPPAGAKTDSTEMPVVAPPQCALPLMSHPLEQFVSGEDKN